MTTRIVRWLVIPDAFGPVPMVSLQQPMKKSPKSFLVDPKLASSRCPPPWLGALVDADKASARLGKNLDDVPFVEATGTVTWHEQDSYRMVTDLRIDRLEIRT